MQGGPKGVGDAVNESVVYAFICLFVINFIMTAIGVRVWSDERSAEGTSTRR